MIFESFTQIKNKDDFKKRERFYREMSILNNRDFVHLQKIFEPIKLRTNFEACCVDVVKNFDNKRENIRNNKAELENLEALLEES